MRSLSRSAFSTIGTQSQSSLSCLPQILRTSLCPQHICARQNGGNPLLLRHRRQQTIVRDTLAPLAELAVRAHSSEDTRSGPDEVCASYLVRSDWVERFAEEVKRLAARNPELWLSCTGPWPPYSFVELEEAA